jgi:uncharacterized lipoprotein YddW (UPF0748 family)
MAGMVRAWRGMAARLVMAGWIMVAIGVRAGAQPSSPAPPAGGPVIKSAACPAEEAGCTPPTLVREFRGVWVATVANMDWPSRPGLPADSARLELVRILDHAVRTGLNAVIFQVRPSGDALYASRIEPWSEYLTGRQGTGPEGNWDPLAFVIAEAHARGLELHAWFNPYRAKDPSAKGPLAATHLARQYPSYARKYGRYLWFDPGEPAVRKRTARVVLDVVTRYDVDGVHFDDYFYPYPEQRRRRDIPFPDAATYKRYKKAGGALDRDDWRRENVNRLIDTVRTEIARVKPWVKFGVSPFGIWRPGEPEVVRGFDAFGKLFADAKGWLSRGWVDYLVPQLYWAIGQDGQPFVPLLQWWVAQNPLGRHVWPGLADYKVGESVRGWSGSEIIRQVDTTRSVAGATGTVHFQMKALLEDRDSIATRLAAGPYDTRAVPPPSPWKGADVPRSPAVAIAASRGGDMLTLARRPADAIRWWAVQVRRGDAWRTQVFDGTRSEIPMDDIAGESPVEVVAVTPVSRTGVAGASVSIRVR